MINAQELPEDSRIPALQAMQDGGADHLLGQAGLEEPFRFERVLRHRVGRRCALLVSGDRRKVVIKAYRNNESPMHSLKAMAAIEKHGTCRDDGPKGARLLASDFNLHYLATEWFNAPSAIDLIQSQRGARAGRLAAQWLTKIQVAPAHFVPVKQRVAPLHRAADKVATVTGVSEACGKKAALVLALLRSRPPSNPAEALCHGSFRPEHIFDLGAGPGLVDWDSAKVGQRELDGGAFLGNLTLLKISQRGSEGELEKARESFVHDTCRILNAQDLTWYEAFSLLKEAGTACRRQGVKAEPLAIELLEEAVSLLNISW